MARILFLAHRIPYPPNKGDKIRSYNILAALARAHEVMLGAFVDDPADLQHAAALEGLCASVRLETISPRVRKLMSLHGLLTGEALSVAFYRHSGMQNWVRTQLSSGVDKVVVFSSAMARFVPPDALGSVPFWMDFVDLDSDKWAQYAQTQSGLMRWIYNREAHRLLDFERDIAGNTTVSSFVTDTEVDLFKQRAAMPDARVIAVHNGVDLDYFSPRSGDGNAAEIVFTGAMDYQANVDAVIWFADAVLPLIQKTHPDAHFTIVGSKPAATVKALGDRRGIDVTGFVDDVRDYVARAAVCIAPMRIARGVQNKVLEAMAMGRPVVATGAGFEGIKAVPGQDLIVADGAADFAKAVVTILDQTGDPRTLGQNARRAMEAGYAWQAALSPIMDFAGENGNGMF